MNYRRSRLIRNVAIALSIAGVVHFIASICMWALFYVASYRNGWHNVLTIDYGVRHLSPAIALLVLFSWSSWATLRRYRLSAPLLACSVLFSIAVFSVEARGDPQFQRVWFDDEFSCSNRQSYYCTWWWWQPRRH
jgi:hypothetical protein